jgi:imidazolonepropionase-like amidohydrolase
MVLVVSLFVTTAVRAETTGRTVIGPVNVVSMSDGRVIPNRAVVVREGRITQISAYPETEISDSDLRVDGQGGYLIPGLSEMHAHIPSSGHEQYARDVLMLYLANGITLARGMLGEPWHLELREYLETGAWEGPRLVTSGPSFNGRSVTSPQQAAEMVRNQTAAGYDFLKLHPGLGPDEFSSLASAAHDARIPFAGHVSFEVGLDAALEARQASIDHLDGYAQALVPRESGLYGVQPQWFGVNLASAIDPERAKDLALATARAGVWNVPTQSLLENTAGTRTLEDLLGRPCMDYVSNGLRRRWISRVEEMQSEVNLQDRHRFIEARRTLIRELQNADAGLMNVPGFSIHEELGFMVASDLSPLEALQSGTINVSRFLDESDTGDIIVGYRADLVLLAANPLQDIAATRQILAVFRNGKAYTRQDLDLKLDLIRSRGL